MGGNVSLLKLQLFWTSVFFSGEDTPLHSYRSSVRLARFGHSPRPRSIHTLRFRVLHGVRRVCVTKICTRKATEGLRVFYELPDVYFKFVSRTGGLHLFSQSLYSYIQPPLDRFGAAFPRGETRRQVRGTKLRRRKTLSTHGPSAYRMTLVGASGESIYAYDVVVYMYILVVVYMSILVVVYMSILVVCVHD